MMRPFLAGLLLFLLSPSSLQAETTRPVLTIYTYDSFAADWGAGPRIAEAFEAGCDCRIEWVTVDSAALLLTRLRLEGARTRADIILGLDTSLMERARATGLLAEHGVELPELTLPFPWTDPVFLPWDWGHFAVIYDSQRLPEPPASLAALVTGEGARLIIQDPRTSTPGLGLLLWMRRVYGEEAGPAWTKLSRRLLTVTKGWSEAYGLFLEGEAPMVLSYATSPAYHLMKDPTDRYRAAIFPEGHYPQIELGARTTATDEPELAAQFLTFLLSPEFQRHIPAAQIMNPVIDIGDSLPAAFRTLPRPATLPPFPAETVAENHQAWIDEWLAHTAR